MALMVFKQLYHLTYAKQTLFMHLIHLQPDTDLQDDMMEEMKNYPITSYKKVLRTKYIEILRSSFLMWHFSNIESGFHAFNHIHVIEAIQAGCIPIIFDHVNDIVDIRASVLLASTLGDFATQSLSIIQQGPRDIDNLRRSLSTMVERYSMDSFEHNFDRKKYRSHSWQTYKNYIQLSAPALHAASCITAVSSRTL